MLEDYLPQWIVFFDIPIVISILEWGIIFYIAYNVISFILHIITPRKISEDL